MRPRTPPRGLKHAHLEQVADDLFRKAAKSGLAMDLGVTKAVAAPFARKDAFAGLPALSAKFLIRTAQGGVGLLVPDGTVIDAMIEFQTLGSISPHPRGDRAVTRVDATMVEPLLVHMMGELAQKIVIGAIVGLDEPLTLGRPEFDAARLDLTLLSRSYDIMTVTLDFGPGVKTGDVQIWLPGDGALPISQTVCVPNPVMEDLLSEVETGLAGFIRGMRVPVGRLARLQPGEVLELRPELLRQVVLSDTGGKDILSARLGQLNGARAVCVTGRVGAKKRDAVVPEGFQDAVPGAAGLGSVPEIAQGEIPTSEPAMDLDIDLPAMDDLPQMAISGEGDDAAPMDFDFASAPMSVPD